MSRNTICAQCEHFALRNPAGAPLPQAAHGIGRCHGYDGHVAPVEPFVRWDARPCVLFGKAVNMAKRLQWIEMRKRKECANAAAA